MFNKKRIRNFLFILLFKTIQLCLGKLFIPVVFMMGVPWSECETVSSLVGVKTAVNEFFAYKKLSILIQEGISQMNVYLLIYYCFIGLLNLFRFTSHLSL